jgi:hypothetical protein
MRRLLGKLIPRSTGGRWAASLGGAAVIGVGIYLVFFVFAFHLIFVDEVVDEEGPEFAVEVDIDQLISDALETGPATTTAAVSSDAEPTDEGPATDQSMSVGEHSADEVEASDGSAGSADSAGTTGSGEADASDGSGDSAGTTGSAESEGTAESDASSGSSEGDDQGVRVAYVGSFGPRSHPAEGTAVVLTDGTQTFLRFDDDFATDNGPDLNVYLHTAGPDASVDDLVGDFIDLGDLKGNIGAQNFVIPSDIDLDQYSTVSVWCVRFRVVFGTAALAPMN